jgi:hypothetical protein
MFKLFKKSVPQTEKDVESSLKEKLDSYYYGIESGEALAEFQLKYTQENIVTNCLKITSSKREDSFSLGFKKGFSFIISEDIELAGFASESPRYEINYVDSVPFTSGEKKVVSGVNGSSSYFR